MQKQAKQCDRRGAVAVEFALVSGLAFFLLFGSLEFSRMNMLRHSIDHAAYEGARRGIVPGATTQDVRASAAGILNLASARQASVTVAPSVIQNDTPEVTVTINVPLDSCSWIAPLFFPGHVLTSSCTLSREKTAAF